jgi:hypothetical protein
MDIVSLFMHQLPCPGFCRHIHLFLIIAGVEPSGRCEFERSGPSIFAQPVYLRTTASEVKPGVGMANGDSFFA